jgi:hypothetical protein
MIGCWQPPAPAIMQSCLRLSSLECHESALCCATDPLEYRRQFTTGSFPIHLVCERLASWCRAGEATMDAFVRCPLFCSIRHASQDSPDQQPDANPEYDTQDQCALRTEGKPSVTLSASEVCLATAKPKKREHDAADKESQRAMIPELRDNIHAADRAAVSTNYVVGPHLLTPNV